MTIRVVIEIGENGLPRMSHPTDNMLTAKILGEGQAIAAEMLGIGTEDVPEVEDSLEGIVALGLIERAKLLLVSKMRQAKRDDNGLVIATHLPGPHGIGKTQ